MAGSPTLRELAQKFNEGLDSQKAQTAAIVDIKHALIGLDRRLSEQIEPRIKAVEARTSQIDDELSRDKNGDSLRSRVKASESAIKSLQICFADVQTVVHRTDEKVDTLSARLLAQEQGEVMSDVSIKLAKGTLSTTGKLMRVAAVIILAATSGGLGLLYDRGELPPQVIPTATVQAEAPPVDTEKAVLLEFVKQQKAEKEAAAITPTPRRAKRLVKPKSGPIGQFNQWADNPFTIHERDFPEWILNTSPESQRP